MQKGKNKYKKKEKNKECNESSITLKNSKDDPFKKKTNFDLQDFDDMQFEKNDKIKEYLFNHSFNQYVRMTLVKILPLKSKRMRIVKAESLLTGPPNECQQLKELINRELQRYAMKMIRFHHEEDIDAIEFSLAPQYDVKVFRIKYVQLAARDVGSNYDFTTEATNLINKMKTQKQILVRILKEYVNQCVNDINNIVSESQQVNRGQSSLDKSRNISMASFITVRPDDSRLTETQILPNSNSSSSDSINSNSEEDGPSFYDIPGVVNKISGQESKKSESRKKDPSNLLSGYLSEPTEEDSVSVIQKTRKGKREKTKVEQRRFEKPQKEYVDILKYEFEEDQFDQKDFRKWQGDRRILPQDEVVIEKVSDPYDQNLFRYLVKLSIPKASNQFDEEQKRECLEYYTKFKKVIFIKLKNDGYKQELIKNYAKEGESLTIEYVKGYKSPKWKENTMWSHILKKSYSTEKKSANTQYFEAFFLHGLKNLVQNYEKEIRDKLVSEPLADVVEEVIFKVDELGDHFRDNPQVKELIKNHVQFIIPQTYSYICKVKELNFILTALKITLLVRFDKQQQFQKTVKQEILNKLTKELKIQKFQVNFIIDKFTYQKLRKAVVIVQAEDKSFNFVSRSIDLGQNFNKINAIVNSINTISQSQIRIDDVLLGKQINQKVIELLKEKEFSQTKSSSTMEKNAYVFKFYGRGYLLDSIQDKIAKYQKELQQNRLSLCQLVRLKEKEVVNNQEFIDKIHGKYKVYLQPTQNLLSCKITVVGEEEGFRKKNIIIKKTKSLDYSPLNSVIVFRNATDVDEFNSCWIKTFKNFIKKHNHNTPFIEKNRNYTIMVKNGLSTTALFKEILTMKEHYSKIVMLMPADDKQVFIRELVTLLTEDKQFFNRELDFLFLEKTQQTNIKHQLGFEEHTKTRVKRKQQTKMTKYYVTDKNQKFYYSESGNKKIEDAIKDGKGTVILNNEDLNITHISHQYNRQSSCIIHLQSNNTCPVNVHQNKVVFTLKEKVYQMPQNETFKVQQSIQLNQPTADLSLGVYEINLEKMEQINLFSGYQRPLYNQVTVITVDKTFERMEVFYDVKIGQLWYLYNNDIPPDNVHNTMKQVNNMLIDSLKTKEFSLKNITNITKEDIEKLKQEIQEDQVIECIYRQSNESLIVKLYDENDFMKVEWRIKAFENNYLNNQIKEQVKYPDTWQPQKEDIQQFIVPEGSVEFNRVQSLFKISNIKVLIRIQNRIIYKKYYQQGVFLKNLHEGVPVKKMELFHGSRNTNPEQIYKDKEQSFNINYSSDSNLLGRGIYFAEKAEYSNSYRYTQQVNKQGIIPMFNKSSNLYSMFLCEVYVGQSEKCLSHKGDIKDTSYRDKVKKLRFESMTDFLANSNVYVVYKSRRAYPLYLIKY